MQTTRKIAELIESLRGHSHITLNNIEETFRNLDVLRTIVDNEIKSLIQVYGTENTEIGKEEMGVKLSMFNAVLDKIKALESLAINYKSDIWSVMFCTLCSSEGAFRDIKKKMERDDITIKVDKAK